MTPEGRLELLIGTVGDSCDYLFMVRHHLGLAVSFLDRAYAAGSISYRGLVTVKDGADPGDFYGTPPAERAALVAL